MNSMVNSRHFYRSAVGCGRVGTVQSAVLLSMWAVYLYGTFGTRMRLLQKIQGKGVLDYRQFGIGAARAQRRVRAAAVGGRRAPGPARATAARRAAAGWGWGVGGRVSGAPGTPKCQVLAQDAKRDGSLLVSKCPYSLPGH